MEMRREIWGHRLECRRQNMYTGRLAMVRTYRICQGKVIGCDYISTPSRHPLANNMVLAVQMAMRSHCRLKRQLLKSCPVF